MNKFLKPGEDCDAECQTKTELEAFGQKVVDLIEKSTDFFRPFEGSSASSNDAVMDKFLESGKEMAKERIAEDVARGVPFALGRELGRKKANQEADLKKVIEVSAQEKETPEEREFLEWWNEGKPGWFGRNDKDKKDELTLPEVLIAVKAELSDLDETMERIERGLHGAYGEWETLADLASEVRGKLQIVWKWLDRPIQDVPMDKFEKSGAEAWKDVSKTAAEWVEELRGKP